MNVVESAQYILNRYRPPNVARSQWLHPAVVNASPTLFRQRLCTCRAAARTFNVLLPRRGRSLLYISLATLMCAAPQWADAQSPEVVYRRIAFTGDIAPGTGGHLFAEADQPAANDLGQIVFAAELNTGEDGYWLSDPDEGLALLYAEGDPAPDLPGLSFRNLRQSSLNDQGWFAGHMQVGGPGVTIDNDHAIYGPDGSGGLTLALRQGDPAPGLPGLVIDNIAVSDTAQLLSESGTLVTDRILLADLDGNAAGRGLFIKPLGGAVEPVAYANQAAPGYASATFASDTDFRMQAINETGDLLFYAEVDLGGGDEGTGVWHRDPSGNVQLLAGTGSPVPNIPGAVFDRVTTPAINEAGTKLIRGGIALGGDVNDGNNSGLWAYDALGSTVLLVREGDPAPDVPGGIFKELSQNFGQFSSTALINEAGDVAFTAGVDSYTIPTQYGLFTRRAFDGELKLIALEGEPAPGTDGAVWDSFNIMSMEMNVDGDILLNGSLQLGGDVTNDNRRGTWLYKAEFDEIFLIARDGTDFEVAPGDVRTLNYSLFSVGGGGEDGRIRRLNDRGGVVLSLLFEDDSEGIFVAIVPEPSTWTLAILAFFAIAIMRIVRR